MSKKKLIAILTLMCFMFTLVPVAAMAEDDGATITGIDFTSVTGNTSGKGYSWNYNTKTLTLDGVCIVVSEGTALHMPADSKIVLAANSTNTIANTGEGISILAEGNLIISGTDKTSTLTISNQIANSTTTNNVIATNDSALTSATTIRIENCTVNLNGGYNSIHMGTWDTTVGVFLEVENADLNCLGAGSVGVRIQQVGEEAVTSVKIENNSNVNIESAGNDSLRLLSKNGDAKLNVTDSTLSTTTNSGKALRFQRDAATGGNVNIEFLRSTISVNSTSADAMWVQGQNGKTGLVCTDTIFIANSTMFNSCGINIETAEHTGTITNSVVLSRGHIPYYWTGGTTDNIWNVTKWTISESAIFSRSLGEYDTARLLNDTAIFSQNIDFGTLGQQFTRVNIGDGRSLIIPMGVSVEFYDGEDDATTTPLSTGINLIFNGGTIVGPVLLQAEEVIPEPIKEGYAFAGWYEGADFDGEVVNKAVTGKTYYAKWVDSKITFDGNGATSGIIEVQYVNDIDVAVTLSSNEFVRDGYTFAGWNTKLDGTGNSYADEATVDDTLKGDVILYAQWEGNPFTIRFNGNGGTSATTMSAVMYYGETEALPANPFTNPGFNFAGWALSLDGEMKYADNAEVTIDTPVANDEMTLYALWTTKEVISAFEELSQAYEYDGNVKAYVIEFDLDGFTIAYKQGDEVIAEPKEIGSYDVVISRAEDDAYAAFNQTIENGLVITEPDEPEDEYIPSSSSSSGFSGSYNYPVSTPEVDNGDVKLSDSNAVEGESVTATITPDNGYGVAEVIVTDEGGNIIPVEFIGNGQYTFVMPDGEVSIEVVCKPAITMVIGGTMLNIFGKIVKNDVAPTIGEGNRTMLPIRAVANALGAEVYWDADNQKVTIVKDGKVIEVFIGKDYAFVDGERIELDAKAYIENGRTYLQVRFVTEALDAEVIWDPVKRMITIIPN